MVNSFTVDMMHCLAETVKTFPLSDGNWRFPCSAGAGRDEAQQSRGDVASVDAATRIHEAAARLSAYQKIQISWAPNFHSLWGDMAFKYALKGDFDVYYPWMLLECVFRILWIPSIYIVWCVYIYPLRIFLLVILQSNLYSPKILQFPQNLLLD